ncbi:hypothetical protein ychA [Buchnera aphidicola str. Bp (Baizongia pistaciae)]|uniref:UPF0162 protein bbp_163 n=1 Tax=Buchnera aphidicola subsp. Baizongia pistaciae (strain Bp) TaxID=224915 RepID=Y163_BUCBP|nr:invasion regulator SirB1 [Buchnera aphidicola]Q89AS9.1 RecName: Full=UPF0162 protein bbp_163 [Buchnera aphidicola str. Bp (Baizongia pistaciae)]AAO26896.1 hypothetical protein ychA [Buchnera aphidicola str. Bp (Baizongia pistaciae)]
MTYFLNSDFSKLPLCESIIEVSRAIRQDFPSKRVIEDLKHKVEVARNYVVSENLPFLKLRKLIKLFYKNWKFECASGIYKLSDVLWLDHVLKTHKGTAVSLGIIILHIAQQLNLPLMPVIFPTQLILRADNGNGNMWLINPFNGDTLNKHVLKVWLKGNISPTAELYNNYLNKVQYFEVVRKMLDILKSALMEERNLELALNVSNVLLKIDPKNPYEIRDRGLIYSQLECDHVALTDLIYFVEHCPDDPISEILKIQIHSMEKKVITLH